MKRFFALAVFLFFIVSVSFFVPGQSYAINPQPEPPGGMVKQGNAINESNESYTGDFGGVKPDEKGSVTTKKGVKVYDFDPQPEPPKSKMTKPVGK